MFSRKYFSWNKRSMNVTCFISPNSTIICKLIYPSQFGKNVQNVLSLIIRQLIYQCSSSIQFWPEIAHVDNFWEFSEFFSFFPFILFLFSFFFISYFTLHSGAPTVADGGRWPQARPSMPSLAIFGASDWRRDIGKNKRKGKKNWMQELHWQNVKMFRNKWSNWKV